MQQTLIPHLYLVYREAFSSVFPSQVLTPLEELQGIAKVSLALLTPIGHLIRPNHRTQLNEIESRCRKASIEVGWIPSPPSRAPWMWSDAFLLRQWISRRYGRDQTFIVRCRNATSTCIAMRALKGFTGAKVIYDVRGGEIHESIQLAGVEGIPESEWPAKAKQAVDRTRLLERTAVTKSHGITCVSRAMAELLQDRYPEASPEKYRIIPCCTRVDQLTVATQHRDALRKELGINDKVVITYLGSLIWVHLPKQFIRVYKLIKRMVPNAHFMAITTEPHKMLSFTQQEGLQPDEVTIRSIAPLEVPRWLAISDFGLSVLRDTERDRICSPLKIAEYLAAGVPVIITPHQGDYSKDIREYQLGCEVDIAEDDAHLSQRLREILFAPAEEVSRRKERCHHYADTHLAWSKVIPKLADWYRTLMNDHQPEPEHNAH